ncbi:DNA-directed RNA polymerase I subunit RPA1-like [Ctenocephalides felis]|uniref:DNA-directed RNA polymerase I subunit RPA1-like n=1 Tax=Ctenocephalides felis TaxID=7515 RepID=UPI000E6E5040|nr:DNA-directed RNA polymerase I subunit RPA1-like [Ctenocephalides felis]
MPTRKTCLPAGLLCKFPYNNLQLMVQSGAKGSTVNTMQISCLLGQIELEGKRPPVMISGKSLPSFPAYEPSPRAGGFIDGRFMTGIQPQEFFFHCMAGREGLIDTAVKTSRSGYLQRCLIKHLEGLTVKYDLTVRDSDNSVIQFLYGEDGMDISKVQFLNKKLIPFLNDNSDVILNKKIVEKFNEEGVPEDLTQTIKQVSKRLKRWKRKYGDPLQKDRTSPFAQYSRKYLPEKDSIESAQKKSKMTGRTRLTKKVIKMWRAIPKEDKEKLKAKLKNMCPDPLISKYQPDHYFGVINENLENLMKDYLDKQNVKEDFEDMIKYKAMTTLCEPGEPVGLLAAQSVGEPSTQMTLNTFHFAGRGEMNVTLGIPRLKEILMTASKDIKTPCMDIPFRENVAKHFSETERLRKRLVRVTIAEVLKKVQVHRIVTGARNKMHKYSVKFEFLPHGAYKNDFCVKPKGIMKFMEQKYCQSLMRAIVKSSNSKQMLIVDEKQKSKRNKKDNDEENEDKAAKKSGYKTFGEDYATSDEDEGLGDDEDATNARKRSRQKDDQEYDVSEDEQNDVTSEDDMDEDSNESKNLENGNDADDVKTEMCDDGFTFDETNYLWCKYVFTLGMHYTKVNLPEILKGLAEKAVIWETPNIKRAITYQNNDGELVLKTDGINIVEMFKYNDLLDLNKLYSNDVHCIAQTYGIEAASRVIVKEVQNVFNVYGITVDPRHLLLIADYMTYDGTFQPLSRTGLETSVSPLQQMSYESSLTFLKQATIKGMQDDLNSPSGRLMVGQPCGTGTGTVSLLNKISHVAFG